MSISSSSWCADNCVQNNGKFEFSGPENGYAQPGVPDKGKAGRERYARARTSPMWSEIAAAT